MPPLAASHETRQSPQMPFMVRLGNSLTLSAVAAIFIPLFWIFCGARPASLVFLGLTLGFGIPAVYVALVPLNPFKRPFDPRPGGGRDAAMLAAADRRILVALYDPMNRRRGALAVLIFALLAVTAWLASRSMLASPLLPHLRSGDVLMFFVIIAWPTAALWSAIFGVTHSIRRHWKRICSTGVMWPKDIPYPGPLPATVQSFFSGKLPDFIADNRDLADTAEIH